MIKRSFTFNRCEWSVSRLNRIHWIFFDLDQQNNSHWSFNSIKLEEIPRFGFQTNQQNFFGINLPIDGNLTVVWPIFSSSGASVFCNLINCLIDSLTESGFVMNVIWEIRLCVVTETPTDIGCICIHKYLSTNLHSIWINAHFWRSAYQVDLSERERQRERDRERERERERQRQRERDRQTERERERERESDRQTDKQTDRQTERQRVINRQTGKHTRQYENMKYEICRRSFLWFCDEIYFLF